MTDMLRLANTILGEFSLRLLILFGSVPVVLIDPYRSMETDSLLIVNCMWVWIVLICDCSAGIGTVIIKL